MKIMLADDDESIRLVLEQILARERYEFCYACDGWEVLPVLERERPDLLILDVMLPGKNGFDLCREIRGREYPLPIIFLSAKSDIVDKSVGYQMGGDDYVAKPFNSDELLLRIGALLRRTSTNQDFAEWKRGQSEPERVLDQDRSVKVGELEVFFNRYEAYLRGEKIKLSSKEFEILAFMAAHPGKVYTREQILEFLWGPDNGNDINSVTVFIRKIREKIEDNPSEPKYLLTVWRVGYKFCNL